MLFFAAMLLNSAKYKSLIKKIAPTGLVAWREEAIRNVRLKSFYEEQIGISSRQLIFDVGANVGTKVQVFRMIGCRVVAFEPQESCVKTLRAKFAKDEQVTIMRVGLSNQSGHLELQLATDSQLASFSEEFVSQAQRHGRFRGVTWKQKAIVDVSTLDEQIDRFGVPNFLKIDVEGFEAPVLQGLSRPVDKLCFEWTPERTAAVEECVRRCLELELTEFNISLNETSTLNFTDWVSSQQLLSFTALLSQNIMMFGDIYARKVGL
jgi:FkbM family methyltransferase